MPSFEETVAELFRRQFRPLFRYLDRLTGDPDVAADLAQDAFVRLYQRGEMPEEPSAWLVTVATNLLRDTHRRGARRAALIAEYVLDAQPLADAPAADDTLVVEDVRARVRRVLDALPPRDRQLLLLRHAGYSYRELATAVGIAEGSVGTLLLRATRAFRTAFTRDTDATAAIESTPD